MKPIAILTATAALAAGGCMTLPDPHPLEGSEWQLVAIDTTGSTTTLTPALQARHTIAFGPEGVLTAQLDCNRGRGRWSAGKPRSGAGTMTIGPVASTLMACPRPGFGDDLGAGLSKASTYVLTNDRRQLVIEADTLRLTFAARP